MTESNPRRRARVYFYMLTLLFLLAQVLFLTDVEVVGNGDVIDMLLFSGVLLIFIALTIQGHNWAKWVLTILLVLFGGILLLAGFDIPSLSLKVVGLYYLLFGIAPHFSQRLRPITIRKPKEDNTTSKESSTPDHLLISGRAHNFPYLIHRYKAMLIDGLLMLILMVICVQIKSMVDSDSTWILVAYLVVILSYEPILVSYSSTIGQKVMKIRVRSIDQPNKRISLGQAYIRFLAKALLGWLSFLTISFNQERRAIHDMVASSVVIEL